MAKSASKPKPKPLLAPRPPREVEPELGPLNWSDTQLDADFAAVSSERVSIERCEIHSARLAGAAWNKPDISDATWENCDLSNASWPECQIFRTQFNECRVTGLRANESLWRHVVWRECGLNLAQFRFGRFEQVRFESCILRQSDFESADLRGVVFQSCDLSEARFQGAKLEGADIRGCRIEGLHIDAASLRGLIIDPTQAIHFVHLLGARILGVGEEVDSG